MSGPEFDYETYWTWHRTATDSTTMFSYLLSVLWGFSVDFSLCKQVSGNDFTYLFIYSSLSDAISNLNYQYMEDLILLGYDTVSMGNWFLMFQGNTEGSLSRVDLDIFNLQDDESTKLSTPLRKPENLPFSTNHWMTDGQQRTGHGLKGSSCGLMLGTTLAFTLSHWQTIEYLCLDSGSSGTCCIQVSSITGL